MTTLWHFSEDATIERFEPRANPDHDSSEPLVWAIDEEHAPAYWFPRDCPRGTYWAVDTTTPSDVDRFLGGEASLRIHMIQADWLAAFRGTRVFGYRLPTATFEPYERAIGAGYWTSRVSVAPDERVELGDLLERHASAGIELRIVPDLLRRWHAVAESTLGFSGIRLRNLGG